MVIFDKYFDLSVPKLKARIVYYGMLLLRRTNYLGAVSSVVWLNMKFLGSSLLQKMKVNVNVTLRVISDASSDNAASDSGSGRTGPVIQARKESTSGKTTVTSTWTFMSTSSSSSCTLSTSDETKSRCNWKSKCMYKN
ncbi:unnamed protein product [Symbiodinium sp. CCMP2456]|nr:unnamed protein product [Symbiodinium sp. CCMP2456]